MADNETRLEKLRHEHDEVRRTIFEYLEPVEPHNLFILGNLNARVEGTHLYAAISAGKWVGLAAYYDRYRSLCPYSRDPEVVGALVRHVATRHRPIEWMNAIGYVAEPALAELKALGFALQNDPREVFMEADLASADLIPHGRHEAQARFIREEDGLELVRLLRGMHDGSEDAPITDRDLQQALSNPQRMVVEIDGRLVSTAATSGVGIRAFQIIAVVTRPGHRRQGYARSVCTALMRHMVGRGARHAVIFTNVGNLAAQQCYRGLGFRVTSDYAVAQLTVLRGGSCGGIPPGALPRPAHEGKTAP